MKNHYHAQRQLLPILNMIMLHCHCNTNQCKYHQLSTWQRSKLISSATKHFLTTAKISNTKSMVSLFNCNINKWIDFKNTHHVHIETLSNVNYSNQNINKTSNLIKHKSIKDIDICEHLDIDFGFLSRLHTCIQAIGLLSDGRDKTSTFASFIDSKTFYSYVLVYIASCDVLYSMTDAMFTT